MDGSLATLGLGYDKPDKGENLCTTQTGTNPKTILISLSRLQTFIYKLFLISINSKIIWITADKRITNCKKFLNKFIDIIKASGNETLQSMDTMKSVESEIRSDCGHREDDLAAVSVIIAASAGLVVALRPLGTVVVVVVDVRDLVACLGQVLGFDQLLLSPPALLAVLHVLPPLLLGPELAHLDLGGRVLVVGGQLARPLLGDLALPLSEQEGPCGSPGDVAAAIWPHLRYQHHEISTLSHHCELGARCAQLQ